MSQLEKAGLSGITAQWPKSAPKKQQQPDAFAPPDLWVWRGEALEHPVLLRNEQLTMTNHPARLRARRGFCILGRRCLPRISGDDPEAAVREGADKRRRVEIAERGSAGGQDPIQVTRSVRLRNDSIMEADAPPNCV
jgi:hypothetical protein